ncbi:hypothetical protein LTS08_008619 [Lithohypha guttulata]|uniref:uncharacterized protein n=1 Tax=Lithohypha guttulata TaxID=1690604 RepID=UPI002DE040E6|nr:hypothetical protein LTS08_008619 [Lithohypha guttulata]
MAESDGQIDETKISHVSTLVTELQWTWKKWKHFTNVAKEVHAKMTVSRPSTWGNIEKEWTAVPPSHVEEAINSLRERTSDLFDKDLPASKVDFALDDRMRRTRRSWRNHQRETKKWSQASLGGGAAMQVDQLEGTPPGPQTSQAVLPRPVRTMDIAYLLRPDEE